MKNRESIKNWSFLPSSSNRCTDNWSSDCFQREKKYLQLSFYFIVSFTLRWSIILMSFIDDSLCWCDGQKGNCLPHCFLFLRSTKNNPVFLDLISCDSKIFCRFFYSFFSLHSINFYWKKSRGTTKQEIARASMLLLWKSSCATLFHWIHEYYAKLID